MKIIAVVNGNQDFVQEQQDESEDIGDFLINPHLTQANHNLQTNHRANNHHHQTNHHHQSNHHNHQQSLKERDAQFLQLQ